MRHAWSQLERRRTRRSRQQQHACTRMQVWRATHLETGEVHALKVVFWGNPDVKEQHKRLLRKEVSVLKDLKHDNIVGLIDDAENDHHLIMALEFLQGGGLLEHLHEVEHYSEAEAAHLFTQMLRAVHYMHSKRIMHRDIKPENVVFTERVGGKLAKHTEPQIKIVDFGLAQLYSSTRSVKACLGSHGFMAPEVRAQAALRQCAASLSAAMLKLAIVARRATLSFGVQAQLSRY